MPSAGFEPPISTAERLQTYASDRTPSSLSVHGYRCVRFDIYASKEQPEDILPSFQAIPPYSLVTGLDAACFEIRRDLLHKS